MREDDLNLERVGGARDHAIAAVRPVGRSPYATGHSNCRIGVGMSQPGNEIADRESTC